MADEHDRIPLTRLYEDREPPRTLEDVVANDFRRFVDARPARRAPGRWPLRIAAGIILFSAGYATASAMAAADREDRRATVGPAAQDSAAPYMLLLWGGPGFAPNAGDDELRREYAAWAQTVAASGIPIAGAELDEDRTLLGTPPSSADGRRIGGYFIVSVASAAAAGRVAQTHPHLRYGGSIEIARVLGN